MPLPPYRYSGSLQDRGHQFQSENPLEEVWSRIGRFGRGEYLKRVVKDVPSVLAQWLNWGPYATIRIRQACELRVATKTTTTLTRPLPLYYSFLGLLRGFLAIEHQLIPKPSHGLRFETGPSLLQAKAVIVNGTFSDYLLARNCTVPSRSAFTLQECIMAIPEVAEAWVTMDRGWTHVIAVNVEAMSDGVLRLKFHYPLSETEFRSQWEIWYPSLAKYCALESEGTVLKVNSSVDTTSRQKVVDFLWRELWVNLDVTDQPIWNALRQLDPKFVLPRDAYYFIALFILSNVVRYEPESLGIFSDSESDEGWLIDRLLQKAERYYPQLMMQWIIETPVFY